MRQRPLRLLRLLPVLALALGGCAGNRALGPSGDAARARPADAYRTAIFDAAVFRPANVLPLRAIPRDADSVRVVTWTEYPQSYREGEPVTLTWADVWVTQEPEVRDACRMFAPEERHLRVEQLLGLPPEPGDRAFVVLTAAVADVFRPCPDPDPSTPSCGREFPADVPEDHVRWFTNQMLDSYRDPDGYPWTRLGYTYNWAAGAARYGASEYVIRKGATARVVKTYSTDEYCRADGA